MTFHVRLEGSRAAAAPFGAQKAKSFQHFPAAQHGSHLARAPGAQQIRTPARSPRPLLPCTERRRSTKARKPRFGSAPALLSRSGGGRRGGAALHPPPHGPRRRPLTRGPAGGGAPPRRRPLPASPGSGRRRGSGCLPRGTSTRSRPSSPLPCPARVPAAPCGDGACRRPAELTPPPSRPRAAAPPQEVPPCAGGRAWAEPAAFAPPAAIFEPGSAPRRHLCAGQRPPIFVPGSAPRRHL